jgi:hypothetical protein
MTTVIIALGVWCGLSFVLAVAIGHAIYYMGERLDSLERRTRYHDGQIDALEAADEWNQSNLTVIRNHVAEIAQEQKGGRYGSQWN